MNMDKIRELIKDFKNKDLMRGYDSYVDYIDHPRQYKDAQRNNTRIVDNYRVETWNLKEKIKENGYSKEDIINLLKSEKVPYNRDILDKKNAIDRLLDGFITNLVFTKNQSKPHKPNELKIIEEKLDFYCHVLQITWKVRGVQVIQIAQNRNHLDKLVNDLQEYANSELIKKLSVKYKI